MRPISVLIVMGPIAQGGAEWQLLELLRRLDRSRFRPVLASIEFGSYANLRITEGDAHIRDQFASLEVPQYHIKGYGRNDPANLFELVRVILREHIDVIHTNLYAGETWGRAAAILTHRPVVTHKRGMPFKSRRVRNVFVDWLLNALTERIITVNESVRDELLRFQPLPPGKFSVIYPGIEPSSWCRASDEEVADFRRELGLECGPVISTVGRLRPIKGHRYLIEAMPGILERVLGARLLVVGHGELAEALRALAQRLGVERKVLFLGSRSDVRLVLSASDVFVLPSLSEASPVALIEAAFVGVASVATRVGGIPEIVRDGETGVLVPARDVSALAAAITDLLQRPDRRAAMAEHSVRWARKSFDIERNVRLIEGEYLRALEHR